MVYPLPSRQRQVFRLGDSKVVNLSSGTATDPSSGHGTVLWDGVNHRRVCITRPSSNGIKHERSDDGPNSPLRYEGETCVTNDRVLSDRGRDSTDTLLKSKVPLTGLTTTKKYWREIRLWTSIRGLVSPHGNSRVP